MTAAEFLSVLTCEEGVEQAAVDVECEPRSAGVARRFTHQHLAAWGLQYDDFVERVVLVISELVTNAIQHARTRAADESEVVTLTLVWRKGVALGVLVADNSSAPPLIKVRQAKDATGGRGLFLVSRQADAWTARPRSSGPGAAVSGKGIWAFFFCPDTT
jgi:anti-sigma regulatory factor (Ser/Thr protein kinase)